MKLINQNITCSEAEELFSPYIDNCLPEQDKARLTEHLGRCEACSSELQKWQEISGALNKLPAVEAPPDFASFIISGLRESNHKDTQKTGFKWAVFMACKALAATAAAALIMFGSFGINSGLQIARNDHNTENRPAYDNVEIADNNGSLNIDSEPAITIQQPTGEQQQEQLPLNAGENLSDQENNSAPRDINQPQTTSVKPANNPDSGGSTVLLSKDLLIESSVMKLAVSDAMQARAQAEEIVASYNGKVNLLNVQGQPQQEVQILQITVPHQQKEKAVSMLASLGKVIDRQEDKIDVTAKYNELLLSYNEMLAQRDAAPENNRDYIDNRIAAAKKQLDSWERDAGNYIVILWLSSNN